MTKYHQYLKTITQSIDQGIFIDIRPLHSTPPFRTYHASLVISGEFERDEFGKEYPLGDIYEITLETLDPVRLDQNDSIEILVRIHGKVEYGGQGIILDPLKRFPCTNVPGSIHTTLYHCSMKVMRNKN
jgi:hypothetical protein